MFFFFVVVGTVVWFQLDTIEDRDERAHTVWWKCKKWAIKLLDRVFDRYHIISLRHFVTLLLESIEFYRYGSPNQVPVNYVVFAKHFLTKWSSDILEVIMRLLNAQRNNIYVSDRVSVGFCSNPHDFYYSFSTSGSSPCAVIHEYCRGSFVLLAHRKTTCSCKSSSSSLFWNINHRIRMLRNLSA